MESSNQEHMHSSEGKNEVEVERSSSNYAQTANASSSETSAAALIERLPAAMRVAYVMRWRCGLSDSAIGAHLHVTPEQARRLIDQAQRTLRRLQPVE